MIDFGMRCGNGPFKVRLMRQLEQRCGNAARRVPRKNVEDLDTKSDSCFPLSALSPCIENFKQINEKLREISLFKIYIYTKFQIFIFTICQYGLRACDFNMFYINKMAIM